MLSSSATLASKLFDRLMWMRLIHWLNLPRNPDDLGTELVYTLDLAINHFLHIPLLPLIRYRLWWRIYNWSIVAGRRAVDSIRFDLVRLQFRLPPTNNSTPTRARERRTGPTLTQLLHGTAAPTPFTIYHLLSSSFPLLLYCHALLDTSHSPVWRRCDAAPTPSDSPQHSDTPTNTHTHAIPTSARIEARTKTDHCYTQWCIEQHYRLRHSSIIHLNLSFFCSSSISPQS